VGFEHICYFEKISKKMQMLITTEPSREPGVGDGNVKVDWWDLIPQHKGDIACTFPLFVWARLLLVFLFL
jgi:hypothetical protein